MTKSKKQKPSTPTNLFTAKVVVSFPGDEQGDKVKRWFNLKNCGQETIPLNRKASKKHIDRFYALNRCRSYELVFEVTESGEWIFVGRKV